MKKIYLFLSFVTVIFAAPLKAQELSDDEIEFAKTGYLQTQHVLKSSKTKVSKSVENRNTFVTGCDSLETSYAAGNGQSGVMFDVVALQALTIDYLYSNLSVATSDMRLYFKTGTYDTFAADSTAWTLLGSANVVASTTNVPTLIPIPINLSMNTGDTLAFYLTRVGSTTTAGTIRYTNGTLVNSLFTSDSALAFYEGVGLVYPFGTTYTPRVWNGTIKYCTGPVSVNELKTNYASLKTYYNANAEQVIVDIDEQVANQTNSLDFVLMDMVGNKVIQSKVKSGKNAISTEQIAKGIYITSISNSTSILKQTKLVIY